MLKENNQLRYQALSILTMPAELRQFVINNCQNPSPYNQPISGSFYNTADKSWSNTPEGTIRVSDHWNFYSRGEMHCVTDVHPSKLQGKWAVGQYNSKTNSYAIIALDEKDTSAFEKRSERQAARGVEVQQSEIAIERQRLANRIRKAKEDAIRAEKIKNGVLKNNRAKIWVEVNVNTWKGTGRNVRFAGTHTYVGYLIWESKTGSSFRLMVNGQYPIEIRKYNYYKELSRKPYTRKQKTQIAA